MIPAAAPGPRRCVRQTDEAEASGSPGPHALMAAGDGDSEQGGVVLFGSNQHQMVPARMAITITRQALSVDGRGCSEGGVLWLLVKARPARRGV